MAIDTDQNKIREILNRGVENIYPNKEFLEARLKSGDQLTLYTGYDPTAPTLHIGNGITMLKLRQFQQLGHKVIMLIGDFTGMIGDPSDKTSTRQKLTHEEVLENSKNYQTQASAILDFTGDNSVELKYNSEWLGNMIFKDVLELTSHFTVPRLLERDMFQERLKQEKTIYLHEFLYPVMQGYDSVAMNVDGEVGGNDQTFNMLAGRSLMKELKNKEKFVLTTKLLVDSSGKKMGKSEGNMIALSDTPEDMFGKVMSWTDDMIVLGYELCTTFSMKDINAIASELENGANPRDAKLKLAYEVTKTFLGEDAAKSGEDNFTTIIQSGGVPDEIHELKPKDYNIITILVESKICSSTSEARRVIEQNSVQINGEKIDDIKYELKPGDIVKKGKRFFVKCV